MLKRIMRISTVVMMALVLTLAASYVRGQSSAKAAERAVIENDMLKQAMMDCVDRDGNVIEEIRVSSTPVSGTSYSLNSQNTVVGKYDNKVFTICPAASGATVAFEGNCYAVFSGKWYREQQESAAMDEVKKIDLQGADFSGVTGMASFAEECLKLYYFGADLSNAAGVTNYNCAFRDCPNLTNFMVGVINTESCTSADSMMAGTAITSFSFANFNINNTKLTVLHHFFSNCSYLQSVDMSTVNCVNSDSTKIVKDIRFMFENCSSLSTVKMGKIMLSSKCMAESLFAGCTALTSVDMSDVELKGITSLRLMFADCRSLRSIDLSHFKTGMVTILEGMFSGCSALESVNLKGWNTSNVKTMAAMFYQCTSLTTIDLSSFNCRKLVKDRPSPSSNSGYSQPGAWWMFSECTNLRYVDLSGFNQTSGGNPVTFDMEDMFYLCEKLEAVNFSNLVPATSGFGTRSRVFGDINDPDNFDTKLKHVCMQSESVLEDFFRSAYGETAGEAGYSISSHEFSNGVCKGCGMCQSVYNNGSHAFSNGKCSSCGLCEAVYETGSHNFVNGVCTSCHLSEQNAYQMQYSLSLGANLAVNLLFDLPDDVLNDSEAYVQVVLPKRTETLYLRDSSAVTIDKKSWRKVSYRLAAKEMSDQATVKVYRGNGEVFYEPTHSVSIKAYGEEALNSSSFTDSQKTLIRAMLNYGAYAQKYFKYNTADLANSSCADSLPTNQTVINNTSSYKLNVQSYGASGIQFDGCSLLLEDVVRVRFSFSFDPNITNEKKQEYISNMRLVEGTNGRYYYDSEPHPVVDWGYECDSVGNYIFAQYSAVAYMHDVLRYQQGNSNLRNLVKSMYVYWTAAVNYSQGH